MHAFTDKQKPTALQQTLSQRLLALSGITTDSSIAQSLRGLLGLLYQSQQSSSGILSIDEVEQTLSIDLMALSIQCPALIGTADSYAPITRFPPFIAFRRTYQQLASVTHTLSAHIDFSPPSAQALQRIQWQCSGGFALNMEQKLAAFSAASLPFCIITGGAGTGKTTTLTKALELILLDEPGYDILLAAPTGKAAQRLNESLNAQLNQVNASVRGSIAGLQAQTLHRLLAISENSGQAFRNHHNPLSCQVLAIDEASMMSSDLLVQVLNALPHNATLILLGDANQLSPINSVSVFNEISKLPPQHSQQFVDTVNNALGIRWCPQITDANTPLANQICHLSKAKRFATQSMVEQCAVATLSHDSSTLIKLLGSRFISIGETSRCYQQLAASYPIQRSNLLACLAERKILCANRHGELGSQTINQYFDQLFRKRLSKDLSSEWYIGRQILIEKNHPDLQLSNGDVGCCIEVHNRWLIEFAHGHQMPIEQLPSDYSLAFAITIHKSQGSEYQHIDIVLDRFDPEHPNPLITPQLLYTALTRARESLQIYSDKQMLQFTLTKNVATDSIDSPIALLLSTPKNQFKHNA